MMWGNKWWSWDRSLAVYASLALVAVCYQWVMFLDVLPAAMAQTVDVRPVATTFVDTAVGALATILSVVGAIGIRIAFTYVGLSNSQLERDFSDRLDDIIHKGVEFTKTIAQNEVAKHGSGLSAVKVDNLFVKWVADYVQPRAIGILKHFAIDRGRLEEMIIARIPSHFQVLPSAGPAVAGGIDVPAATTSSNTSALATPA